MGSLLGVIKHELVTICSSRSDGGNFPIMMLPIVPTHGVEIPTRQPSTRPTTTACGNVVVPMTIMTVIIMDYHLSTTTTTSVHTKQRTRPTTTKFLNGVRSKEQGLPFHGIRNQFGIPDGILDGPEYSESILMLILATTRKVQQNSEWI
jgi:hypothetical protein